MAGVRLVNVQKSYGTTHVLRDINLTIHDGEFMVFVGPSGCGKSTLLRSIAGLEDITGGELFIGDRLVNDVAPAQRGIAMVFQSYALYPHMNLFDNMAFGLQLAKVPKDEIERSVRQAARILNIEHLLDRKPKDLSGGQRQRVAIGRAIVRKPEVFLFDEPLSNLDTALRVRMRYEFAKLHDEFKSTMIYVTHDQVEAMTLADRIVVLSVGRIEQVGAPLTLYHHPDNLFVAGFIGSPAMNFLDAEVMAANAQQAVVRVEGGATVTCAVDAAAAKVGDKVKLGVRPEDIRVATAANAGDNRLDAQVTFVECLGGITHAYCTVPGCAEALTCELEGDAGQGAVRAGQPLVLAFAPDRCYLFDATGKAFRRHAAPEFLAA